jgi:uncharacterized BrkB/YihY/UPF0761 family membrane protein
MTKRAIRSVVLGALLTLAVALIASALFGRSLLWIAVGGAIGGAVAVLILRQPRNP